MIVWSDTTGEEGRTGPSGGIIGSAWIGKDSQQSGRMIQSVLSK